MVIRVRDVSAVWSFGRWNRDRRGCPLSRRFHDDVRDWWRFVVAVDRGRRTVRRVDRLPVRSVRWPALSRVRIEGGDGVRARLFQRLAGGIVTRDQIVQAAERAREWARVHAPDQYNYFSTAAWVGAAHHVGIITRDEYDAISKDYGDSFWYTGD